jgi:hypothetical protein
MWKRRSTPTAEPVRIADGFSDWVASLPYVVQRPHGLSPTVAMFDVDCTPLERHVTWLVVDHGAPTSWTPTRIAVLLPRPIARAAERSRLGVCTAPMLPDHVLFSVDPLAHRRDVESLVLAAYGAAMS